MNDLEAFANLAQALAPWRAQLVFIGGWAHRLHRFHPSANALDYQAVFTRDTDLAFANNAPIEGDIKDALVKHGFKEELSCDHQPPVTAYSLGGDASGFYAEFLTPLVGSGRLRSGKPDATLAKGNITAQKIRHLDILLHDPWVITLDRVNGIPVAMPMDIQVVNPLCFMAQKFLIQKDRPAEKQAQDLLYVYDTLELFGTLLGQFNTEWKNVVRPALGEKLSDVVVRGATDAFAEVTDVIRNAATIPQDRQLAPEQIQMTCRLSFAQILKS